MLVTTLLDDTRFPTAEFSDADQRRWPQETFCLMLKGRSELESFDGETVEAVHQDF